MSKSIESLDQQRKRLPAFTYRQHMLNCIYENPTLCLIGETGSGKSTQIPQYILESGMLNDRMMIAVTQPRRVACITLAHRVAREKNNSNMGDLIGYAIRFENKTSERTKIKYMTEGILLREAITDKFLSRYQVIFVDEAHERTIGTDVLFGILKKVQKDRQQNDYPELKIIIMSATMDVDHFSDYFDKCPVLVLPGKTFPITINHVKNKQEDYMFTAIATLLKIHLAAKPQEDVLMFLTGKDEIESMCHQIRTIAKSPELEGKTPLKVYPLHSSLPQNKQFDAFTRSHEGQRRVVVATNIAETSITIPGIKYVIDTGVVKQKKYEANTGMETLKVTPISQAQAQQRTGRAGRECPGVCYRTYTVGEMEALEKMTKPEILRCNLTSTILQLLAIGINVETFDFLDKPPHEAISAAFKHLKQLGAIKSLQNPILTETGRKMAHFPLDPMYSKCIVSAVKYDCVSEMLDLVAILSTENVYCEPGQNNRDQAMVQHAKFTIKYGDHLTLLNIFHQYQRSEKKRWCVDHFLNSRNLMFASDVRHQLAEICESLNISTSKSQRTNQNHEDIGKCLITGLFNNIAEFHPRENNYMVLASRQRALIHPSSVLSGYHSIYTNGNNMHGNGNGNGGNGSAAKMRDHNQRPSHIIFSEIVQTTNTYLRSVTQIDPEWIHEVKPDCDYLNQNVS